MADFAPTFTERYRVLYKCATHQHKVMFRLAPGTLAGGIAATVTAVGHLFDVMAPGLCGDLSIISAEAAEEGSTLFLPAPPPTLTIPGDSAHPGSKGFMPNYFSMAGLSSGGAQARVFFYGRWSSSEETAAGDDYRLSITEGTFPAAAIAAWTGIPGIVAIDRNPLDFPYQYVNLGSNPYYQRRARRG